MDNIPLIVGYGNPERGDDGLGPLLVEHLECRSDCESRVCFQLQPELVLDMRGRRFVLFADASLTVPPPFLLCRIKPEKDEFSYTSHVLTPSTLLRFYEEVLHSPPPPTFLLSIRGEQFELGKTLSATAKYHLEAAICHLFQLLENGKFPAH